MEIELGIGIALLLGGAVSFTLSTLTGGGGALLLVPYTTALLGVGSTAPVVNLGTFIGRPTRLVLFWKHICWPLVWVYAPAAILGAWLSAQLIVHLSLEWIQLVVGLFLISTLFQYRFGKRKQSFHMRLRYFAPLGFVVAILGTLVGGMGPILNPFYLNIGLQKEALIATKTANSFIMGMAQISTYSFFGLLHHELWLYGLLLGIGTSIGNLVGKNYLKRLSNKQFRIWLIVAMVISGSIMVFQQSLLFFTN